MSWVNEMLEGVQEPDDDLRQWLTMLRDGIRLGYEKYRRDGLEPDEARIMTQSHYASLMENQRQTLDLNAQLIDSCIMDCYLEEVGDD